ncbi:ABC transporter permease [Microbacterium esteraromaticum]|uniref:ABC transporter permease n=1 Tax=Microbacterium esteraromaticum TaxID=57043 RepID=UPI003C2E6E84
MFGYVIRRLFQVIPVFFGTTFLIFVVVFALPGDPIAALGGGVHHISESAQNALRERYNLNDPLPVQYAKYMLNLLQGNMGTDFLGREVSDIIARNWPTSIMLGVTAWVLQIIVGIPLGIWAALNRGGWQDKLVGVLTTLAFAVPLFVVAYVSQILFGVELGWFPVAGASAGWPVAFILPAAVLALLGLAAVARLTRTSLIENLSTDYVRTAIAKGMPRKRVIVHHALRNSLIPVITFLGIEFGALLGGAVIIEGIFNLPGLGNEVFKAIGQQNGPAVVGISTLLVLVFLVVNLIVDITYAYLDPRIRRA